MRKNLVIARVGAGSLHAGWLSGTSPARNWDLYLSPYEPIVPDPALDCVVGEVLPGPKWTGLRQLLNEWDGWRDYQHVWLPDDDIRAEGEVITSLFDVAAAMGLRLYAPALDEASYFDHFLTKQNRLFFGRRVGFVEIMVPGFETGTLATLLRTLDLTSTGWGYGLDSLWPKLLGYGGVAIIDGLTVTHTRPMGSMRDDALAERLLAEEKEVFELNDCRQVFATFEGFGPDLEPLHLDGEELTARLIEGWRYLLDEDPSLAHTIEESQGAQPPSRRVERPNRFSHPA